MIHNFSNLINLNKLKESFLELNYFENFNSEMKMIMNNIDYSDFVNVKPVKNNMLILFLLITLLLLYILVEHIFAK